MEYERWSSNTINQEEEIERIKSFIQSGAYDDTSMIGMELFSNLVKKNGCIIQIMECTEVGLFEGKI